MPLAQNGLELGYFLYPLILERICLCVFSPIQRLDLVPREA